MMTIKETIKKLEELRLHCQEYATDRERDGEFDTVWHGDVEALDKVIEIAEKEIPKKIKIDIYSAFCPTCSKNLVGNRNCNYCHNCGQKLDWEG